MSNTTLHVRTRRKWYLTETANFFFTLGFIVLFAILALGYMVAL